MESGQEGQRKRGGGEEAAVEEDGNIQRQAEDEEDDGGADGQERSQTRLAKTLREDEGVDLFLWKSCHFDSTLFI